MSLTQREALLLGLQTHIQLQYPGSSITPALERNELIFWVSALLYGSPRDKVSARRNIKALVATGHRRHAAMAAAAANPLGLHCGKMVNGFPCDLPKGTVCPDCDPSHIEYCGE